MALNLAETAKELRGAASHLLGIEGVTSQKAIAIGFCMGGQLALFSACSAPDVIGGAIDFYGVHPAAKPDLAKLSGAVQFHFATRDRSTPPEAANAHIEAVRAAGKTAEPYFYEAQHAFFNDQRPQVYDAEAAELAWTRVLDFLARSTN